MSWKSKREIRFRYDAEADGYDELYSAEQKRKYELALSNLAAFTIKDRILDSGCGTGNFLEKVASNVQFSVGVDLSLKALRKAQLKLGRMSNVELVYADFDFLPFLGGTFEHVFMFTVLPALVFWSKTIREALRVLTTYGTMTLSVPKRETSAEKLVAKLRGSRFQPQNVVDHQAVPDYLVVGRRACNIVGQESKRRRGRDQFSH